MMKGIAKFFRILVAVLGAVGAWAAIGAGMAGGAMASALFCGIVSAAWMLRRREVQEPA